MGASRSGRWGSSKPFAEGLARFDLADCPADVSAARAGRVLVMRLPTSHGFDVTAEIRFTTTPLHFGGCRVWMICPSWVSGRHIHSITSSVTAGQRRRASSPSAFAVLRRGQIEAWLL
jgi:hypothetical protein